MSVEVAMLTGDSQAVAKAVADELGIQTLGREKNSSVGATSTRRPDSSQMASAARATA
jgi:magnesium-transporting ATPase (P-type)